ncbi:MAG: hypothetical protein WCK46_02300 [Candidatus Adlerbacteria bacterium]
MQQFLRTKTILSFVLALSFVCVPTLALAQEDGEQQGPAPEQQQQYDPPTQPAPVDSSFGGSAEVGGGGGFSLFKPPAVEASGWRGGEAGFQQQGPELGQEPVQYKIQDTAYTEPDYIPFTQVAQQPTQPAPVDSSFGGNAEVAVGGGFSLFKEPQQETPELGQEPVQYKTQDTAYTELDYMPLNQAQAPAPEQQDPLNAQLKANGTNAQNVPPPPPLQEAWDWFVAGTSGNVNNDGAGPEHEGGQGNGPVPVGNLGTTLESGVKELRASPETGGKEDYIFSEKNGGSWTPLPLGGQERTDVVSRLQAEGYLAEGQNAKIVEVRDGAINAEPIGFGIPGISPTSGVSPVSSKEEETGSNAGGKPLPYDEKESTLVPAGQTLSVADGKGSRLLLATPEIGGSGPAAQQAPTPAPNPQSGGGFFQGIANGVGEVGATIGKGIGVVADTFSSIGSTIGSWFTSTPATSNGGGKFLDATPAFDSPANQAQTPAQVPVTPVSAPEPTPAPTEQKVGGPNTINIPDFKEEEIPEEPVKTREQVMDEARADFLQALQRALKR